MTRTTIAAWITAALTGLGGVALAEPPAPAQDDEAEFAELAEPDTELPPPPAQHVLFFDADSTRLDVPARQELELVIRWLRQTPERRVVIEEHGSQAAPERTRSARDYLISRGVRSEQVIAGSGTEQKDGRVIAILSFRERAPVATGGPASGTRTVSRVEQISTTETTVDVEGPPLLGVMVGGGVFEFADAETRVFAETGGAWNARFLILPRSILSAELAYIGSAQEIDALGLDDGTALVGTGIEAGLRLNAVGNGDINSYVYAGVGYTHFSLEGADFNTSNVDDSDGVLQVPFGVGLSLPVTQAVVLDIRGLYRAAFGEELIATSDPDAEENDLDNWSAMAQVGWLF